MTPPRAVVEAVLRHVPVLEPGIAQQLADDVLAAHYAGEVEGEWVVVPGREGRRFWACLLPGGANKGVTRIIDGLTTEPDASRVAHALNWRGE